jgi:hypothetical protein
MHHGQHHPGIDTTQSVNEVSNNSLSQDLACSLDSCLVEAIDTFRLEVCKAINCIHHLPNGVNTKVKNTLPKDSSSEHIFKTGSAALYIEPADVGNDTNICDIHLPSFSYFISFEIIIHFNWNLIVFELP